VAGVTTYFIVSLGCSKNLSDSEKINGVLSRAGFIHAVSERDADIVIINTCGFITDAKKESIDTIFDALAIRDDVNTQRRGGKKQKVVVVGCLSQRYLNEIREDIPEIDLVYGIPDDNFVRKLIALAGSNKGMVSGFSLRLPLDGKAAYEYIKIADGCSNHCSYCAIPLIRGALRSFSPDEILADARDAVSRGVRELIIIAQDIAAYDYRGYRLHQLLDDLGSVDVPWIRLLYCHPDHLDDRIVQAIRDNPRIVHYLDLPFQHANDGILSRMNRKGNAQSYLALIGDLRKEIPDIVIRSTFMTGFPGETDDAFHELLSFIEEARLDRVGSFVYSPEEGTAAAPDDDIPPDVKEARRMRLMDLQAGIGSTVRVLVEEEQGEGEYLGRTEFDAPEVDGVFFLTAKNAALHDIVMARITDAIDHDLAGEI
jgi:ribosomal protein S12 methylthiotransferase